MRKKYRKSKRSTRKYVSRSRKTPRWLINAVKKSLRKHPRTKKLNGRRRKSPAAIKRRLAHLRRELRAERISYGELHELQSLAPYIEDGDVELLEAAGVPEFGPGSRSSKRKRSK